MEAKEELAAIKDILACLQKPGRSMGVGRILAPKLLGLASDKTEAQASALIFALQQVIEQELQNLRSKHLGPEGAASYRLLSAQQRLERDSKVEASKLQNLSIVWAYYGDGISKETIKQVCKKEDRTIEYRMTAACNALLAHISDPSFVRPQPRTIPEPKEDDDKRRPRLTLHLLKDDLLGRGQFNPVQTLNLHATVKQHAEGFDFLGIKWTSVFAFTVALVQADGMSKEEIDAVCKRFADFNDSLEDNTQGLGVPWYLYHTSFTLSGILCLVYEHDTLPQEIQTHLEQRPGPAYDKGIGKFFWIQTQATTLYWVLDARSGRLLKHLGKQPDKTNMHARWTVKHSKELEQLLLR